MTRYVIYIKLISSKYFIIYKSTIELSAENDITHILNILSENIFKNLMVVTLQRVVFKCMHM